MITTIDFETRSYADLTQVGAWPYSEHPTTEVICMCWARGNGPVQEWCPRLKPRHTIPRELARAILMGDEFEAHNVSFEISIWKNILVKHYGWPDIPLDQWRDSMAVACYYALPAALDKLARALHMPGKDPDGSRLITKYSKLHLKTAKTAIPAEDLKKFVSYCRQDVTIERDISNVLGALPERELPIFLLDLETNLRGVFLDQEGMRAAMAIVDEVSAALVDEFRAIAGVNPTQRDKVIAWFRANGVALDNLQAEYLGDLMESGTVPPGPARRALEIRLEINKASTKKLDAMARHSGKDGRARFQTRYHGAVTGRNTGSGFQPLNMNRGFDDVDSDTFSDQLVGDIMLRDPEWLDVCYGDAMDAVAKASRHWIQAQPGNKIVAGDLTSIEAVILACLAGEEWKVDAFRRGEKIYERTAEKIYGMPPGSVKKGMDERQDGKKCELAFGYQGALGAWLKFDPRPVHTDETIIGFCRAWRREHPATTTFWRELESAAIYAVGYPGHVGRVEPSGIEFQVIDQWLTMKLPSGNRLWYFQPQLRAVMPHWHQPATKKDCASGACDCRPKSQVTYMSQKDGQWKRVSTYGGKLAENATQGTSREVLEAIKPRVKAAGYNLILTVYDELVTEVPANFGSKKELEEIMSQPIAWAPNWPITAKAWEGDRYRA